jgi:hypothetical protein
MCTLRAGVVLCIVFVTMLPEEDEDSGRYGDKESPAFLRGCCSLQSDSYSEFSSLSSSSSSSSAVE